MRIALGLQYDGQPFYGWQTQPHGCTIQDHLTQAVKAFTGQVLSLTAAGRTDTGVHASAQVVHFDSPVGRSLYSWVRGINSFLPNSIAVQWAREVPPEFHARFSAFERHYDYFLFAHPVRPALLAGKVGWFHRPLDPAKMQEAARVLEGTHNFSSFAATACQAKSPIKHCYRVELAEQGPFLRFHIRANAFLHHMVRNIIGALVQIGSGRQPVSWMADLLQACNSRIAIPTFMPDGLYLSQVFYPAHFDIPQNPFPVFPNVVLQPN